MWPRAIAVVASAMALACSERVMVPVPADGARLEPAVKALVEEHLTAVRSSPDAVDRWRQLALVYEANDLWGPARATFAAVARLAPDDAPARYHLALASHRLGEIEPAVAELRATLDRDPRHGAALQLLGYTLLERGDQVEAEELFARLVAVAPSTPYGHVAVGEALLRRRDFAGAARSLERALELDAGNRSAHYQLGMAYRGLGDQAAAARHLEIGAGGDRLMMADPLSVEARRYAVKVQDAIDEGRRRLAAGDAAGAAEVLEVVRASSPEHVGVANNLATAYMSLRRYERAVAVLDAIVRTGTANAHSYVNLAEAHLALGRLSPSLAAADRAVELAPAEPMGHRTRARALQRLQRVDEALVEALRALELEPDDGRTQLDAGVLRLGAGQPEAALDNFDRALALGVDPVLGNLGRARALIALGRLRLAEESLAEARRRKPDHPMVLETARQLALHEGAGPR